MRWRVQPIKTKGFTLIELMLALSLGSLLFALMLRLIGADLRLGQAMAQRFRETSRQQRSLELIREELALAHGWMLDPPLSMRWPCPMAGRRPVLAIATQADDPQARGEQVIVYAVGPAPDRIWRGQVLMRCGPGYSLDGVPPFRVPSRTEFCWMPAPRLQRWFPGAPAPDASGAGTGDRAGTAGSVRGEQDSAPTPCGLSFGDWGRCIP